MLFNFEVRNLFSSSSTILIHLHLQLYFYGCVDVQWLGLIIWLVHWPKWNMSGLGAWIPFACSFQSFMVYHNFRDRLFWSSWTLCPWTFQGISCLFDPYPVYQRRALSSSSSGHCHAAHKSASVPSSKSKSQNKINVVLTCTLTYAWDIEAVNLKSFCFIRK